MRRHHAAHSGGSGGAADIYQQPDKINYTAIACALQSLGVTHVIAACSVGSLKPILSVGSLLVPSDYFAPWCCVSVHADKRAHIVPQLDPRLRAVLLDAARECHPSVAVDGGVYVQTQGPRFETKAEISFLQGVGDVVGMTGAVEAAMMQEVGLPYAMICSVDNMAHGIASPVAAAADPLTLSSFTASAAANRPAIERVISRAISLLSSSKHLSATPPAPLLAHCDIMIHCGIVLPVLPHRSELRKHSIIIRANLIADLLPTSEAVCRYSAAVVHDLPSHIVMPGLVNLHTHAAMKLMKGVGSDLELMPWLQQCVAPPSPSSCFFITFTKILSSAGTFGLWKRNSCVTTTSTTAPALHLPKCCWEAPRASTTCAQFDPIFRNTLTQRITAGTSSPEHLPPPFCPSAREQVCASPAPSPQTPDEMPVVGVSVLEFPNSWGAHPDDAFKVAEQCIKEFEGCSTLKYAICPHAPYTVSDASLVKCRDFQREHGLLMHSHMHETLDEVENSLKGTGAKGQGGRHMSDECCRPFANYHRLGLLSDSFIGAHCVHSDAADIELMKVTCPVPLNRVLFNEVL